MTHFFIGDSRNFMYFFIEEYLAQKENVNLRNKNDEYKKNLFKNSIESAKSLYVHLLTAFNSSETIFSPSEILSGLEFSYDKEEDWADFMAATIYARYLAKWPSAKVREAKFFQAVAFSLSIKRKLRLPFTRSTC